MGFTKITIADIGYWINVNLRNQRLIFKNFKFSDTLSVCHRLTGKGSCEILAAVSQQSQVKWKYHEWIYYKDVGTEVKWYHEKNKKSAA